MESSRHQRCYRSKVVVRGGGAAAAGGLRSSSSGRRGRSGPRALAVVGEAVDVGEFPIDDLREDEWIQARAELLVGAVPTCLRRQAGRQVERLYWCGFERDDNAGEAHTQWVKNKTSPFSSLSTPR